MYKRQAPYEFSGLGQGYGYVEDPLDKIVNSVNQQILYYYSWAWQSGCVFEGYASTITAELGLTGWYLGSDTPADYYYCMDDGMGGYIQENWSAAVDYVSFENDVFCLLTPTYAQYYPQETDGNSDGSLDGYYDSFIFGSYCSGWLSPQSMQLTILY